MRKTQAIIFAIIFILHGSQADSGSGVESDGGEMVIVEDSLIVSDVGEEGVLEEEEEEESSTHLEEDDPLHFDEATPSSSSSQPPEVSSCGDTEHGCCPDGARPQHGPRPGHGCCAATEHGCCPDNLTPAPGPFHEVTDNTISTSGS